MSSPPPHGPEPERLDDSAWDGGGYAMTAAAGGPAAPGGPESGAPAAARTTPPGPTARMTGVLEQVRAGTFMMDSDGIIRDFRPDAELLLGRCRASVVGKPFAALFADGQAAVAERMLATVLRGDDAHEPFDAVVEGGGGSGGGGGGGGGVGRGAGGGAAGQETMPVDLVLVGLRDGDGHVMILGYLNSAEDLYRVTYDRAVLDSLFEQFPVGVVIFDAEGRYVRLNHELERINGIPAELHVGRRISEVLPGLDPRLTQIPDSVLATGEPVVDAQYGGVTPASEDERVWSVSYNRLNGPDGEVLGLSGLILDVTERHRNQAEAQRTRGRLALVNAAGSRIGTSLDVERTVRELAAVAVPDFADTIVIQVKEEVFDERIGPIGPAWLAPVGRRRALVYSGGPGPVPELVQVVGGFGSVGIGHGSFEAGDDADTAPDVEHARALTGRATLRVPDIAGYPLVAMTGETLVEAPKNEVIIAPLLAREALLGMVYFLRNPGGPVFEPADVEVAEEITTRAAVSVDNARLYNRERSTALMLQRALLPQRIPPLPGVEVAFRYLPGSVGAEVGGDWFDVIQLSGSRVALVVGDVMGIGVRAAGIMGQFRTAVRTLAGLDLSPAQVLHQLDELGASLSENHLATCLYAVYDPATGKLAISRAGHPPPLLLSPDGSVGGLDVPASPPLGVGGGAYRSWVFETMEFDIPDGSRIAFYTDGMVEDKGRDIDQGIGNLAALLANCPPGSLEACCDAVVEVLGITGDTSDDATLLLAQVTAIPPERKAHWQLEGHPAAVAHARRMVREKLEEWDMTPLSDTAQLLVSELVTNAQRYGHSPVELDLLKTDRLLVEVGDALDVVPQVRRARETDEGGRGLQLVNQLATRWGTRPTAHGKIVWFELAV